MTKEEQEKREKGIQVLNALVSPLFIYEPISELKGIRDLAPFQTDKEFLDYLASRPGAIKCRYCPRPAEHWELMKTDKLYKVPICTVCRDKDIMRRVEKAQKRGKDPNEGRYSVIAEQARNADRARRSRILVPEQEQVHGTQG